MGKGAIQRSFFRRDGLDWDWSHTFVVVVDGIGLLLHLLDDERLLSDLGLASGLVASATSCLGGQIKYAHSTDQWIFLGVFKLLILLFDTRS